APGEYPYVCTFPGHWRGMYGTMHVGQKLADVPPHELNPPTEIVDAPPFVKNWTYQEPQAEPGDPQRHRPFQSGKELFTAASCIQCHKIGTGTEGGIIGPDLNEIPKKLADRKLSRADLLREVIDPSKVIADKFKTQIIITDKGEVITGIILFED